LTTYRGKTTQPSRARGGVRAADGSWGSTLSADGTSVDVVGVARDTGPGMQAVAVELARLWLAAKEKGKGTC
jgi:hypothetical protein